MKHFHPEDDVWENIRFQQEQKKLTRNLINTQMYLKKINLDKEKTRNTFQTIIKFNKIIDLS